LNELKTWIAALRSGEYKQTTGSLQDYKGYCCLGVACKVLIPKDQLELNTNGDLFGTLPIDQSHPPEWLKDINRDFSEKTGRSLSVLNDTDGLSFNEIADLLEKNYLTPNTNENEN
jgi:hypothetical protein